MADWSDWRPFPDPRHGGVLVAPFGPGCYELRRRDTGDKVLFGYGGHVAHRMTSLLPEPFGSGRRNNAEKRQYVLEHLGTVEYRTIACQTEEEAKDLEREIKRGAIGVYIFTT